MPGLNIEEELYDIKRGMERLGLKQTQTTALFKQYGCKKIGNSYVATEAQIKLMEERERKCKSKYDLLRMDEDDE